jgi:hypothetical protein
MVKIKKKPSGQAKNVTSSSAQSQTANTWSNNAPCQNLKSHSTQKNHKLFFYDKLATYPCIRTGRAFGALYFVGSIGSSGVCTDFKKKMFKVKLTVYNQLYLE